MKAPYKKMIVITVPVIVALTVLCGVLVLVMTAGGTLEQRNLAYAEAPKPSCAFEIFAGHPVDEAALAELGRPYRILAPGAFYTMDYNPLRINLDVGDDDVVTGVWCG